MVGRFVEAAPLPAIPTDESDLIVTGRILAFSTHLSNDKSCVYTEYKVKVDQVLNNKVKTQVGKGGILTVDRAGGAVRYPNSQVVIYLDSIKGLPEVGREYIFFLNFDENSGNYSILTLYELQESHTVPLDSGRNVEEIKQMDRSDFLKAVERKLPRPSLMTN